MHRTRDIKVPNNHSIEIGDTIISRATDVNKEKDTNYSKSCYVAVSSEKFYTDLWTYDSGRVLLTEKSYKKPGQYHFIIDVSISNS